MSGRLDGPTELLFRQAPAAFVREGRLTSQAFEPGRNDEGRLSVARESLTTAEGDGSVVVLVSGKAGGVHLSHVEVLP